MRSSRLTQWITLASLAACGTERTLERHEDRDPGSCEPEGTSVGAVWDELAASERGLEWWTLRKWPIASPGAGMVEGFHSVTGWSVAGEMVDGMCLSALDGTGRVGVTGTAFGTVELPMRIIVRRTSTLIPQARDLPAGPARVLLRGSGEHAGSRWEIAVALSASEGGFLTGDVGTESPDNEDGDGGAGAVWWTFGGD